MNWWAGTGAETPGTEPMELPARKKLRLREYDYSQNGAYFVTICTKHREHILSRIEPCVGPDALIGPLVRLTTVGEIVEKYIKSTETAYPSVRIEHYVIMPNHVHLLVRLTGKGPMGASGPTLFRIVKAVKGLSTRAAKREIWQDNYYEHIIRDENDFLACWQYIENNPAQWAEDEYYGGTP